MDKSFRHIADFLEDDSFRTWVLGKGNMRSLYWENWLNAHPGQADLLYQAKEILLALEKENEEEEKWQEADQIRLLNNLYASIDKAESKPLKGKVREHYAVRGSQFTWLKVSVILLVMVVSAVLLNELAVTQQDGETGQEEVSWVVRTAAAGEKKKVILPDGSKVILNAASELRYRADFGTTHRDLSLSGESYFEVEKDTLLPFRVYSGALVTEALGTAFNISAFEGEAAKVKLVEGKVKVELTPKDDTEADRIYLDPGEQAVATSEAFAKGKFDPKTALLWTAGTLYFDDQPLTKVIKALERWYGVTIKTEGQKPSAQRVSGEFHRDNLENVLQSISYSFDFDFNIDHKEVTIQFK
ncbi:FecR family protein [Echinicola vietnamensis]|uniref:Fe2+-dicitrate sensor, membrane component n=1 Tax=Echinicola vietnamensis (strain DSM 17526 / LMG 23754 / KMM 6221) TaxID=926556 RepID=L0FUN2_ECHVK|nr:FecR domain-containing protein [Echinicola vietnamensis]AGA77594.1 Fe2+-dicitrate sensor, membrane component [Echinicola vietnamensis DSM 17526]